MNAQKTKSTLCLSVLALGLALTPNPVPAFEVEAPPDIQRAQIQVSDPDQTVNTLGEVEIHIDLSASRDDLLDLKVRRSGLTMPGGLPFHSFAAHKEGGLVVLGSEKVEAISIASVKGGSGHKDALVLFHGKGGEIIAPSYDDVALFDLDFKPLPFTYEPLAPPGSTQIPVNILLDKSGSMAGHMAQVQKQTQDFMRALPDFARCTLRLFNRDVTPLHLAGHLRRMACAQGASLLSSPVSTSGSTALFAALDAGLRDKPEGSTAPLITVVITDGMNTAPYAGNIETLKELKEKSGAKLFMFWAGNYRPDYLKDLADLELVSTNNLEAELERFFRSLGISISGLQSLRVQRP